jgi:hypothetical protein
MPVFINFSIDAKGKQHTWVDLLIIRPCGAKRDASLKTAIFAALKNKALRLHEEHQKFLHHCPY